MGARCRDIHPTPAGFYVQVAVENKLKIKRTHPAADQDVNLEVSSSHRASIETNAERRYTKGVGRCVYTVCLVMCTEG